MGPASRWLSFEKVEQRTSLALPNRGNSLVIRESSRFNYRISSGERPQRVRRHAMRSANSDFRNCLDVAKLKGPASRWFFERKWRRHVGGLPIRIFGIVWTSRSYCAQASRLFLHFTTRSSFSFLTLSSLSRSFTLRLQP